MRRTSVSSNNSAYFLYFNSGAHSPDWYSRYDGMPGPSCFRIKA